MDLMLADRGVLITGGAKGIGAAAARAFIAEGARVAIVDRDAAAGSALARDLGSAARFVEADLTDLDACARAVEAVATGFGGMDVLVNNAGFNDGVGLDQAPERFLESLRRNLVHVYAVTHHAREHLKRARGAIVNVSSKVAVTGQGATSGYAAAKGAINALTREWALTLAADGVRVNAVVPAECATDQYERWFRSLPDPEGTRAAIERMIPLGRRMTTSDEVAAAIVFLVSPRASHTTGQLVYVDGGYTHLDRAFGHEHRKWDDPGGRSADA